MYAFQIENKLGNLYEQYIPENDCESHTFYRFFKDFSEVDLENETLVKETALKAQEYILYMLSLNNTMSSQTLENLRNRRGLEWFDFSEDEQIFDLSPSEMLSEVVRWNGLLGGYEDTITRWVKDIYGVDLNEISKQKENQKKLSKEGK